MGKLGINALVIDFSQFLWMSPIFNAGVLRGDKSRFQLFGDTVSLTTA
jgi:hypothetical protein